PDATCGLSTHARRAALAGRAAIRRRRGANRKRRIIARPSVVGSYVRSGICGGAVRRSRRGYREAIDRGRATAPTVVLRVAARWRRYGCRRAPLWRRVGRGRMIWRRRRRGTVGPVGSEG